MDGGHLDVVSTLLDSGANVDVADEVNRHPKAVSIERQPTLFP